MNTASAIPAVSAVPVVPPVPLSQPQATHPATSKTSTPALALLALGIVYGDIGTSPLYAVKETFNPEHGIAFTAANIIGGVSCIFWALMVVVSLKYVSLVLRANNRGEGGIMALLALASKIEDRRRLFSFAAPREKRSAITTTASKYTIAMLTMSKRGVIANPARVHRAVAPAAQA